MSLRATLFDMDGLLIDSEILWHEAELEIFGALGVPVSATNERSTKGLFVAEVVAHWYRLYPWSGPSVDDVVAMVLQRVGDLVEEKGVLLPGATRAIEICAAWADCTRQLDTHCPHPTEFGGLRAPRHVLDAELG